MGVTMKRLFPGSAAIMAAMALAGASPAMAEVFHTGASNASLKGTQAGTHKFTVQGLSVTCTTAEFTGKGIGTTSTTQKMHPHYTGCTAFGFTPAAVETLGCNYIFSADTSTVDLEECTNGKIEIDVVAESGFTRCHVNVKNQTNINGISYDNDTVAPINEALTVTTNSTNIAFEVTTSTGFCPLTVASGTNGVYTGTTVVKANNGASTIWRE